MKKIKSLLFATLLTGVLSASALASGVSVGFASGVSVGFASDAVDFITEVVSFISGVSVG